MKIKELEFLRRNIKSIDFPSKHLPIAQALLTKQNVGKSITKLTKDLKCSRYIIQQVNSAFQLFLQQNFEE